MLRRNSVVTLLLLVACLTGCTPDPGDNTRKPVNPSSEEQRDLTQSSRSEIENVLKTYQDFEQMTPEPVYVNPELAILCVGATKEMVDHARIEKGPHANCLVRIFMNAAASKAFANGTTYPAGSVIIKEKRMLGFRTKTDRKWNGMGNGIGGMIKRPAGFDEPNGDWEYFYTENESELAELKFGRMESCIDCHAKSSDTDYVYGSWNEPDRNEY